MPMPPMPPAPPMKPNQPGPAGGGTIPAAPMKADKAGGETQQRVMMGIALWMMSRAHAAAPMSPDAPEIATVMGKLGKKFAPPPKDIGESEMKYMQSQYNPTAQPGQQSQAAPPAGMPPAPPSPPMNGGGAAPMAA